MRKLRAVLLAVAIALGVPAVLLAWRALDGLEMERALRHQAVAERAFDEMERALSDFLEAEEQRPFEHYAAARQPLPFVLGAFQIDPDGGLSIPLEASSGVAQSAGTVRRILVEHFETEGAAEGARTTAAQTSEEAVAEDDLEASPAPGTTRPLAGPLRDRLEAPHEVEPAPRRKSTAYDAIQSLNRAADERIERRRAAAEAARSYRAQAPLPPSASAPSASDAAAGSAMPVAEAEVASPAIEPQELAMRSLRDLGYAQRRERADAGLEESARAPTPGRRVPPRRALQRESDSALSLARRVEPMSGRAADAEHILLYRTALRDGEAYLQGLVIDSAALGRWLAREVLASSVLAEYVAISFGPSAQFAELSALGAPLPRDVFLHRFAEPFDALSARMQLVGLPGARGPGTVHALVALLALVGAAGLFAIHRMASVVVQFAERRSNFVAAVTHELKTPLTAIRMYGEMLRDGMVRDDAKRAEYYATITDESERLSRLIDNVLEFSRLEHDTREMNWTVGVLGPVLCDVAERLGAHAARQDFRLETAIEPDLPAVRFDRDALVQVLFNLVDNAMKYASGAEDRRIVLEARRARGGISVAVRDFGPGVPSAHLARVFEPFYRGEDELTRTTKGTGIGLALVEELAQRMDAAVSGRNVPGGGFRVELVFGAR